MSPTTAPSTGSSRVIRGACAHDCPDTCATLVTVEDGRATRIQGDPEAAEAAAQIAVKIDKTRMQPARNGHGYAIDRARSRRIRSSAEVRVAGFVVSEYHDPFTADLPERCQALRLSPMETSVDGRERTRLQRG